MNENYPSISEEYVKVRSKTGDVVQLKIIDHWFDGRKSFTYRAENSEQKKYIIKLPKPGYDCNEELEVLSIIAKYPEVAKNIPEYFSGEMQVRYPGHESRGEIKFIALEYLENENQWESLKSSEQFQQREIIEASIQAAKLFKFTHEKGIVNTDIKTSNFYWVNNVRFVLIDWNTIEKIRSRISDQEAVRKNNIKKQQNYVILFNYLYKIMVGSNPPEPLPEVNDNVEGWNSIPLIFKRIMSSSRKQTGFEPERIINKLEFWLKLVDLKRSSDWVGMDNLANEYQIRMDTLSAKELLEFWPENISNDIDIERDKIQKWIIKKNEQKKALLQESYEDAWRHLRDNRVDTARKICEKILDDPYLEEKDKWGVAKCYALTTCIVQLSNIVHLTSKDMDTILDSFINSNKVLKKALSNIEAENKIKLLFAHMTEADKNVALYRHDINSMGLEEQISKIQKVDHWLDEVKRYEILPIRTIKIFMSFKPDFDLASRKREKDFVDQRKKKQEIISNIKSELNEIIGVAQKGAYPVNAIEQIIYKDQTTKESIEEDFELRKIFRAHLYMVKEQIDSALLILDEAKKLFSFDNKLLLDYQQLLINNAILRLSNFKDKVLYRSDIELVKNLNKYLINQPGTNFLLDNELQERISAARQIETSDLSSIKRCQELKVEPYCYSSLDPLLTERILIMKETKSFEQEIGKLENEFQRNEKLFSGIDNRIKALRDKTKKLQDLRQSVKNASEFLIDEYRNVEETEGELKTTVEFAKSVIDEQFNSKVQTAKDMILKFNEFKNELPMVKTEIDEIVKTMDESFKQVKNGSDDLHRFIGAMEDQTHWLSEQRSDLECVINSVHSELSNEFLMNFCSITPLLKSGDFAIAIGLLKSLPDLPEEDSPMIEQWIDHLQTIEQNQIDKNYYIKWFQALKEKDSDASIHMMKKLGEDISKPLYEYLCNRHLLFFPVSGGSQLLESKSREWWGLFENGKISILENEIAQFEDAAPKSSMVKFQLSEWKNRIKQVRELIELLKLKDETGKYDDGIKTVEPTLRVIIPDEVWAVAERIFYQNDNGIEPAGDSIEEFFNKN